jgi:ribosome-binding factor A
MQSNRPERLAETIRQEASEIIEYELTDERIGAVTVTGVKVTADLRNAKIFVNIDGDRQKVSESLSALRHAAGFIRYQIGLRLQLKRVPELTFQFDDTLNKAARIEQLLREETETGHET